MLIQIAPGVYPASPAPSAKSKSMPSFAYPLTSLPATLTELPASVATKRLTPSLSPVDATLTKTRGEGGGGPIHRSATRREVDHDDRLCLNDWTTWASPVFGGLNPSQSGIINVPYSRASLHTGVNHFSRLRNLKRDEGSKTFRFLAFSNLKRFHVKSWLLDDDGIAAFYQTLLILVGLLWLLLGRSYRRVDCKQDQRRNETQDRAERRSTVSHRARPPYTDTGADIKFQGVPLQLLLCCLVGSRATTLKSALWGLSD